MPLRSADFGWPICIKTGAGAGLPANACHEDKRSPRRNQAQDAETVQFGGELCRCGDSRTDFGRRVLVLEMRLGGDHLLVKDAHDLNAFGFQNEKHNMLANLKATQAWTN
jgi:hypothetical protein